MRSTLLKEKKDKLGLITTGSLEVKEVQNETEEDKSALQNPQRIEDRLDNLSNIDQMQVSDIMEQILNLAHLEKDLAAMPVEPGYILSCDSSSIWLYSITRRSFFEVKSGSEILSIEKIDNDKSQCLINSDVFEVSNEMIICVG